MIEMITLDRLALSEHNPRKTRSQAEIDALAASISEIGLQQNMIGYAAANSVSVEIVGGGTRLMALQKVHGAAAGSVSVPVVIYEDLDAAIAAAVAENEARTDMHPLDAAEAYARHMAKGWGVQECARAFGKPVAEVKRILVLNDLHPDLREKLREGVITVDQARAFSLGSPERQIEFFRTNENRIKIYTYNGIRAAMAEAKTPGDSYLAMFVGRERYEAAGHVVITDLFGDKEFYDTAALEKLEREILFDLAKDIAESEGWEWFGIEMPDSCTVIRPTCQQAAPDLTEEEAAEYDRLAELHQDVFFPDPDEEGYEEALDEFEHMLAEMPAEEADGLRRLRDLLAKIEAANQSTEFWNQDQKSVAGVVVTRGQWSLKPTVQRGVVTAEHYKAAVELGVLTEAQAKGQDPDPEEQAEAEKPAYSSTMVALLEGVETIALGMALSKKPMIAAAFLASEMSSVHAQATAHRFTGGDVGDRSVVEGAVLGLTPIGRPAVDTLAAFVEDKKKREATIAQGAAWGLTRLGRRNFGALREELSFSLRDWWTPGEEFFAKLKVSVCKDIFREVTGKFYHELFGDKGKAVEVKAHLTALFQDPKGFIPKVTSDPGEQKAIIAAVADWVPPPLRLKAEPAPAVPAPAVPVEDDDFREGDEPDEQDEDARHFADEIAAE